MSEHEKVKRKLLLCDTNEMVLEKLRTFCSDNQFMPVHVSSEIILRTLRNNIDVGGALLSAEHYNTNINTFDLVRSLHKIRPELPLILRVDNVNAFEKLPPEEKKHFVGYYVVDDLSHLKSTIEKYIFNIKYPASLVRIIHQVTKEALQSELKNIDIKVDSTFLVNNDYNFGDVVSLMTLDCDICNGYLMTQVDEADFKDLISNYSIRNYFRFPTDDDVNNVLGELSNLIWGGVKNKLTNLVGTESRSIAMRVPIVGNQEVNYMSFGKTGAKLCIKYLLTKSVDNEVEECALYQVLIINQSWILEVLENKEENGFEKLVSNGVLDIF